MARSMWAEDHMHGVAASGLIARGLEDQIEELVLALGRALEATSSALEN